MVIIDGDHPVSFWAEHRPVPQPSADLVQAAPTVAAPAVTLNDRFERSLLTVRWLGEAQADESKSTCLIGFVGFSLRI